MKKTENMERKERHQPSVFVYLSFFDLWVDLALEGGV